ncbi:MAG: GNAT family N-acetyltransferase [Granulosicoccus sp.]
MDIKIDDLQGSQIKALLQEHLEHMQATSPPESTHALDLPALRAPDVTFWCAWDNDSLLGCGALKELSSTSGEIKSMRTAANQLRRGVASSILQQIIDEAKQRAYKHLSLETGSMEEFASAHKLYLKFGFVECEPFADYIEDPNSIFLTLRL